MQIQVTEIEPCRLKISYQADLEKVSNKRAEIVSAFKRAPVPGFRPGKASPNAIKMHYRDQIEDSLKRALAEEAFHDTLFEKKLRPHGGPRFNSLFLGDGKFNCEFDLHVKPDFELAEVKGLEVVKPHEPEDVVAVSERMMQELRVRFGDVAPYAEGDFVQSGDSVIVDYSGFIDGEKVENLSAEGEMMTVGKSDIPSFDDNLLGMALGETREFDFVVPDNGLPSLVGKTIHFKVTLNMGSKITPCPLDDSLAAKFGKSSFTELKEFVLGSAQAQVSAKFKNSVNEAICAKLVSMHTFTVPHWLTLSEARYLAHNSKLNWDTLADADKEKYLEMSERNVKLSLVLDRVRESDPDAQLSDQETFNIVKQHLSNSKLSSPIDDVINQMNNSGYLQVLFSRLKDEYTLDFIVKKAKIIE